MNDDNDDINLDDLGAKLDEAITQLNDMIAIIDKAITRTKRELQNFSIEAQNWNQERLADQIKPIIANDDLVKNNEYIREIKASRRNDEDFLNTLKYKASQENQLYPDEEYNSPDKYVYRNLLNRVLDDNYPNYPNYPYSN